MSYDARDVPYQRYHHHIAYMVMSHVLKFQDFRDHLVLRAEEGNRRQEMLPVEHSLHNPSDTVRYDDIVPTVRTGVDVTKTPSSSDGQDVSDGDVDSTLGGRGSRGGYMGRKTEKQIYQEKDEGVGVA